MHGGAGGGGSEGQRKLGAVDLTGLFICQSLLTYILYVPFINKADKK